MIIYKVENLINGKIYIGLTIRTLEARKSQHIRDALNNKDKNVFHRALRKYGEENFKWEVIDNAETEEELKEKEIYYISFYNSYIHAENSNGYNLTYGGEGTSGYKLSNESKRKIGDKSKGRIFNEETKKKMSNARKGKTFTDEHKQKISDSKKGVSRSEETKKKIREANIGKKHTEDTKEKISKAFKGSNHPRSKLTEEDVKKIKSLLKEGKLTHKEIAVIFEISASVISAINVGGLWRHIK